MHFRKLVGKQCYLSPMTPEDAEKYTHWLNDQSVVEFLVMAPFVISLESEKAFLSKLSQEHNYAIVDLDSNETIGSVGLVEVNHINQTAEIGIFIGNKDFWGKGFGREALSLLLDYAFMKLNLHNIMLRVYAFNQRAIDCYQSIGFREIGKIREGLFRNRQRHDIVLMDILAEQFYQKDTVESVGGDC